MAKSKFTQKDKQKRGTKGEADITASLKAIGLWNHKFINAGYGTVFDKIIIPPGGGYAIEIKVREAPRIAYNTRSITNNERKGLDKFMKMVGENYAYIIGIWKTKEFQRAFLIPWHMVRDDVCSGKRGSIKMLDFPEIQRKKVNGQYIWDLSMFCEVTSDDKQKRKKA
jgi:hypothetical protein